MKTLIVTSLIVLFASTAIVLDVQSWQHRRELNHQPKVIKLGPGCGDAGPAAEGKLASATPSR